MCGPGDPDLVACGIGPGSAHAMTSVRMNEVLFDITSIFPTLFFCNTGEHNGGPRVQVRWPQTLGRGHGKTCRECQNILNDLRGGG